ncbi:hypothetical protein BaRGS_00039075, partial [Batillaria attramentaria]
RHGSQSESGLILAAELPGGRSGLRDVAVDLVSAKSVRQKREWFGTIYVHAVSGEKLAPDSFIGTVHRPGKILSLVLATASAKLQQGEGEPGTSQRFVHGPRFLLPVHIKAAPRQTFVVRAKRRTERMYVDPKHDHLASPVPE